MDETRPPDSKSSEDPSDTCLDLINCCKDGTRWRGLLNRPFQQLYLVLKYFPPRGCQKALAVNTAMSQSPRLSSKPDHGSQGSSITM